MWTYKALQRGLSFQAQTSYRMLDERKEGGTWGGGGSGMGEGENQVAWGSVDRRRIG